MYSVVALIWYYNLKSDIALIYFDYNDAGYSLYSNSVWWVCFSDWLLNKYCLKFFVKVKADWIPAYAFYLTLLLSCQFTDLSSVQKMYDNFIANSTVLYINLTILFCVLLYYCHTSDVSDICTNKI